MADEMDLNEEGYVSFTVTVLLLIKLAYVLWKELTGQLFQFCPVIAKYPLKIFLIVRRPRELKWLKYFKLIDFILSIRSDLYLCV